MRPVGRLIRRVASKSNKNQYEVRIKDGKMSCNCPKGKRLGFLSNWRRDGCSHIIAALDYEWKLVKDKRRK